MQLTPQQNLELKNWIIANNNSQFDESSVALLNSGATPVYRVWDRGVSVPSILDKVQYTNFTPNDDPSQATATAAQVWENRAMLIQIKQINLQLLLQGRETFDATKSTLRNGLQDCTETLPSGNNGNARTGGWSNIQPALSRVATALEKLFAIGSGTVANPSTTAIGVDGTPVEGPITLQQVIDSESAS